jgi:CRISPR-associated protein Cmr1
MAEPSHSSLPTQMIRQTYSIDIITPCLSGGANPETQAEIRASSIRGQLRWWFRVLGGFKSLGDQGRTIREQEDLLFGQAADDTGKAGNLQLRVRGDNLTSGTLLSDQDLAPRTYPPNPPDPKGYLVWPLQSKSRAGFFDEGSSIHGKFDLQLTLKNSGILPEDLVALVVIMVNLGALGFRSRRAYGALAFTDFPYPLTAALKRFSSWDESTQSPSTFKIRQINVPALSNSKACITELAKWLRGWRNHGQMFRVWKWIDPRQQNLGKHWHRVPALEQTALQTHPGWKYARRDHNDGLDFHYGDVPAVDPKGPHGNAGTSFRPALGLPIQQRFSSVGTNAGPTPATVHWDNPEGRFASPVLLRPHRTADKTWHALVLFIDCLKWDTDKKVTLSEGGRTKEVKVSLELYEQMQETSLPRATHLLKPFPPP